MLFIVALLCFNIVQPVFALGDIQGFGDYTINEIKIGNTVVGMEIEVNTKDETALTDQSNLADSFTDIFIKYGKTITWATGIATITLVIIWIIQCVKLAFMAPEHWMLRRQTTMSLLWIGIATALMGSTTLILSIFQYALV